MYNLNVPIKAKDPPWFAVQMGSVADSVVAKIIFYFIEHEQSQFLVKAIKHHHLFEG